MSRLRALRSGVLTEFEFENMGEVRPGIFRSRFEVLGGWARSDSQSADPDRRLAKDMMVMALNGYSTASLEVFENGGWSQLGRASMSGIGGPHLTGVSGFGPVGPAGIMMGPAVPPPSSFHAWMRPDPRVPDTLGWREWLWNGERLRSPVRSTFWPTAELTAETWTDEGGVRGEVGIHAHLVPRHWKVVSELGSDSTVRVAGIVERFGRYVLGTEGWRAEQAVIRELMAPSTEIGLALEQAYPDVIVHYPDQTDEGEFKWTSEKSSELERGSRSLLPSSRAAPAPPPPPDRNQIVAIAPLGTTLTFPSHFTLTSSPPEPVTMTVPRAGALVFGVLATSALLCWLIGLPS
jgi:hypothetical protein